MEIQELRTFGGLAQEQKEALFGLVSMPGIGAGLAVRLLRHFSDAQAVFEASHEELSSLEGLGPQVVDRLLRGPDKEAAQRLLARVEDLSIGVHVWGHDDYPQGFSRLSNPPPLLYTKGATAPGWHAPSTLALVGTRRPDHRGVQLTREATSSLVRLGFVIASGGALGIDTAAHQRTLELQGRTIAVLATGVDRAYPHQNRRLFEQISNEGGVLVSEFPPGTMPEKGYFPRRNRLISGLSCGVVVVQCGAKSGALNTADHARRQGVPVLAFPGPPRAELSAGPHRLIRQGALLVESGAEIASLLSDATPEPEQLSLWEGPKNAPKERSPKTGSLALTEQKSVLDPTSRGIFELLNPDDPQHVDQLATQSQMAVAQVSACLLEMELEGVVVAHPGMRFTRA